MKFADRRSDDTPGAFFVHDRKYNRVIFADLLEKRSFDMADGTRARVAVSSTIDDDAVQHGGLVYSFFTRTTDQDPLFNLVGRIFVTIFIVLVKIFV